MFLFHQTDTAWHSGIAPRKLVLKDSPRHRLQTIACHILRVVSLYPPSIQALLYADPASAFSVQRVAISLSSPLKAKWRRNGKGALPLRSSIPVFIRKREAFDTSAGQQRQLPLIVRPDFADSKLFSMGLRITGHEYQARTTFHQFSISIPSRLRQAYHVREGN